MPKIFYQKHFWKYLILKVAIWLGYILVWAVSQSCMITYLILFYYILFFWKWTFVKMDCVVLKTINKYKGIFIVISGQKDWITESLRIHHFHFEWICQTSSALFTRPLSAQTAAEPFGQAGLGELGVLGSLPRANGSQLLRRREGRRVKFCSPTAFFYWRCPERVHVLPRWTSKIYVCPPCLIGF